MDQGANIDGPERVSEETGVGASKKFPSSSATSTSLYLTFYYSMLFSAIVTFLLIHLNKSYSSDYVWVEVASSSRVAPYGTPDQC